MKITILLFSILFPSFYNDCEKIPASFNSYSSAINIVNNTQFKIEESIRTYKSSWIVKASYYSCDEVKGFFILETKDEEYIHQDVPVKVWKEFKNAESYGKYYNANIKENYNLKLK